MRAAILVSLLSALAALAGCADTGDQQEVETTSSTTGRTTMDHGTMSNSSAPLTSEPSETTTSGPIPTDEDGRRP